jgi:hypothetical protein
MRGGVAVRAEGLSPLWRVNSLGGRAIRLPLVHWFDYTDYLKKARAEGWDVLAVLDRDGFSDWDDWRNSIDDDLRRIDEQYVQTGLITHLAVGNEFDDGWAPGMNDDPEVEPRGGPASWVMPFAAQQEMLARVWQYFLAPDGTRTRIPLVLGGMSSGQPDVIDYFDLSMVSAIQIHPYGKRPSPDWPDPNWGTGFIGWWLDPLSQKLEARGLADTCRILIGELGINYYNINGDQDLAAQWYTQMLTYLDGRGDVDGVFIFCDSDQNVDGYGAFDAADNGKLAVAYIREVFDLLPDEPLLALPAPPEPEPYMNGASTPLPWFDQHFSPEEIAQALANVRTKLGRPTKPSEVIADIRDNWAEFGPFLKAAGVDGDANVKMGLLATIFYECVWVVKPRDEIGDYAYFEANYGYQTARGRALGNTQPGDGARYKGRGYQMTGKANYAHYGQVLGAALVDRPEDMNDPTLAAGAMVAFCKERGMFEAAMAGNWEQVRRAYNGALGGYDKFVMALQELRTVADFNDPNKPPPPPNDTRTKLAGVVTTAATQLNTPYVWGGKAPPGMDCSGFVSWAYRTTLQVTIPSFTDAIYDATLPITESQAVPGDIVLYEYQDGSQPGVRFPHVGLVTDRPGITLDDRGGVGVGFHAHVNGAVRIYRRAKGLGAVAPPSSPSFPVKALNDALNDLEVERSKLDDYGSPPEFKPKVSGKPTKDELTEWRRRMQSWAKKVQDNTDERYKAIGDIGARMRALK